jgi:hypothetical protein
MKNLYLWATILICVSLSLIPPIEFVLKNPPNDYWPWMILMAGTAGFFTIFIETDLAVKLIAIGGFVNCFFSAIPYVSFTSYVTLVLCCYLYIMASRIDDWSWVFKAFQTVVIMDIFLFCMQYLNHDPLLNFGTHQFEHFGTLGQHMMMGSFAVIIGAVLIQWWPLNMLVAMLLTILSQSSWGFFCCFMGLTVMAPRKVVLAIVGIAACFLVIWGMKEGKINTISGRLPVWEKTIHLANERPLTGWGIGTYKDIFFPLSGLHTKSWREAHDFILQLLFEVGYPCTIAILIGLLALGMAFYAKGQWLCLSGLVMIVMDSLVHFPDRMLQTVPLIVIFLAYTRFSLRRA